MQVKKFEAKTMKDALTMIKNQLGPEAIILSAKDIGKSYGIAGQNSVEVTAAISEVTLRKKQLAERKLNEKDRQRFSEIPASRQKEFIDKVFDKIQTSAQPVPQITRTRYADIFDEDEVAVAETIATPATQAASTRIKSAAAEALKAASFIEDEPIVKKPKKSKKVKNAQAVVPSAESIQEKQKLLAMQAEINHLKGVISEFQKVPQSFLTMHPGASEGISFELSPTFEKMRQKGIDKDVVVKILRLAQKSLTNDQLKRPAYVDAWVAKYILDSVNIVEEGSEKRFHAFVGPSGHGKTASLVKMASHMVICQKKSVAIVTCDNYKVGAVEQLKIYARILNVPFVRIKKPSDWEKVDRALAGVDHILIDYPGMGLRSEMEREYLQSMLPPTNTGGRSIHYVQSTMAKNADAYKNLERYSAIQPSDIIFTSLDESSQHGIVLNLQDKFKLPLHSFGIGPKIPEDFELATKERVVDLLFKLTKLQGKRS